MIKYIYLGFIFMNPRWLVIISQEPNSVQQDTIIDLYTKKFLNLTCVPFITSL